MRHPVLIQLTERYPALESCVPAIESAYVLLEDAYASGGKLLLCGNGGSCADAQHIAGELMKGFLLTRRAETPERARLRGLSDEGVRLANVLQEGLPAIALGLSALDTAVINDLGGDMSYAQSVYALGRANDVLLGISTSGNAANVRYAALAARARGLRSIGLTGADGGQMNDWFDVMIRVPARETYQVQEYHLPVYHALCAMLEARFFA